MKLTEQALKTIINCNKIINFKNLAGGDSGTSLVKVSTETGDFVIKTDSRADAAKRFEVEGKSLEFLGDTDTIKVPKVHSYNEGNSKAGNLVIEYLNLESIRGDALKTFGRQLAQLHSIEGPSQFGWDYDNYLGQSPQLNEWKDSWFDLYNLRLDWQLDQLQNYGYLSPSSATYTKFQRVRSEIDKFFKDLYDETTDTYNIKPSPLHGDLWSGNYYQDANGTPIIIDPAFYWGHSEADLSIMTMFGSPGTKFFDAYFKELPKQPLFDIRHALYQLYHYVNHWIMFGGGYQYGSEDCLNKLVKFLDKN